MSCKRLSHNARGEQDYWLSFSDFKDVTEEERIDFLRYDSHGGEEPQERRPRITLPFGEPFNGLNPVLLGKKRYGQYGGMMRDGYFDMKGGWPGGLQVVSDYLTREPFNVRPLREWFGDEAVHRWLTEFLDYAIPRIPGRKRLWQRLLALMPFGKWIARKFL